MKKEFPKWLLPWMLVTVFLCVAAAGVNHIFRMQGWSLNSPSAGQVVAFHDANTLTNVADGGVGGSGGTNYPPVVRIGTNIAVGVGVRQSVTLQTNASFAIVFTGAPLNGEHISLGVSNIATSVIYMTNTAGIYDPSVASNVTTFAIAATSVRFFEFVSSTNFALGAARWEVRDMLGKEVELAAGNQLELSTNAAYSTITMSLVTNVTANSFTTSGDGDGSLKLTNAAGVLTATMTATNGGQITLRLASIPTNDAPFTRLSSPLASGQFWTNTTGARCLLAINYTLTASAVSGAPSLCMTNITSGETYNATNSLALGVIISGRTTFFVGTNEYFVITNQSSGNASSEVVSTVATRH